MERPSVFREEEETLFQDANRQFCALGGGMHHKRDIMPDCVLKLEVLVPQPSGNAVCGTQMGIELHLISTVVETLHTYFWGYILGYT